MSRHQRQPSSSEVDPFTATDRDDEWPLTVDISVQGHIPPEVWPTEEQVSSAVLVGELNRLINSYYDELP